MKWPSHLNRKGFATRFTFPANQNLMLAIDNRRGNVASLLLSCIEGKTRCTREMTLPE
jgi:hypothetical protein